MSAQWCLRSPKPQTSVPPRTRSLQGRLSWADRQRHGLRVRPLFGGLIFGGLSHNALLKTQTHETFRTNLEMTWVLILLLACLTLMATGDLRRLRSNHMVDRFQPNRPLSYADPNVHVPGKVGGRGSEVATMYANRKLLINALPLWRVPRLAQGSRRSPGAKPIGGGCLK